MNNSAQEIWDRIVRAENILHIHDTRFDFDALCSALFLHSIIKQELGKNVEIIFANTLVDNAAELVDTAPIKQNCDVSTVDLSKYDLITLCDSGDIGHISNVDGYKLPGGLDFINIDHHSGNNYYGTYNYVKLYCSCCTVLYDFVNELGIQLSEEQRRLLALGAITDSGFFAFSTVTPHDLRMMAQFLEDGLNYTEIVESLKHNASWDEMMFRKLVYGNLKEGRTANYAYSFFELVDLERLGINMEKVHTRHSDLIKYLKSVDFVFVVKEDEPGVYGVSFRSSDLEYDVLPIAQAFGGGGHKVAAAGKLEASSVEDAIKQVEDKLEELLKS